MRAWYHALLMLSPSRSAERITEDPFLLKLFETSLPLPPLPYAKQ